MPSASERDDALVWDMLDAAKAIASFTQDRTFDDYMNNRMLRGAVERNLEILGIAAKQTAEFRTKNDGLPLGKIIGLRNVLAHEYGEIKHGRIWQIVTEHLTPLIHILEPLWAEIESRHERDEQ